jgi:hypothetical protein
MKTELIIPFIAGALIYGISVITNKRGKKLNSKIYLKDGTDFVNHLEKLEYFKYAAPVEIKALKETMIEAYNPAGELVTNWDDDTGTPKDFRLYICDGEDLFELGGFIKMLDKLQPTFDKIGFKITVTDHIEEWDETNNWLNHSVTLNGNNYTIFKHFKDAGWGEAAQTFADILNTELALQKKEDCIYLINGGNDGRLIFLEDRQYRYIDTIYRNEQWKPLPIKQWCKVMGLKPQKINP